MNNRLNLFRVVLNGISRWKAPTLRKLHTDSIYPYPHKHIDTVYPSRFYYRETWIPAPWVVPRNKIWNNWMKLFWTYWWYMLFNDPGVILGHFNPPDPRNWSDEELGIPPESAGPYKEWIERKSNEDSS